MAVFVAIFANLLALLFVCSALFGSGLLIFEREEM